MIFGCVPLAVPSVLNSPVPNGMTQNSVPNMFSLFSMNTWCRRNSREIKMADRGLYRCSCGTFFNRCSELATHKCKTGERQIPSSLPNTVSNRTPSPMMDTLPIIKKSLGLPRKKLSYQLNFTENDLPCRPSTNMTSPRVDILHSLGRPESMKEKMKAIEQQKKEKEAERVAAAATSGTSVPYTPDYAAGLVSPAPPKLPSTGAGVSLATLPQSQSVSYVPETNTRLPVPTVIPEGTEPTTEYAYDTGNATEANVFLFQCDQCKQFYKDFESFNKHPCTSKGINWNKDQTKLLIELYTEKISLVETGKMKKKSMWELITANFQEHGHNFNSEQISGRWKSLVRSYKSTKDHNNKSGNNKKTFEYEKDLDEIFSNDPVIQPLVTLSSNSSDTPKKSAEDNNTIDEPVKKKKKRPNRTNDLVDMFKNHLEYQRERDERDSRRSEEMHKERLQLMSSLIAALSNNTK